MRKGPLRLNREQQERITMYATAFGTGAGKEVLEDLKEEFGGQCATNDIWETFRRTVQRDLVEWMEWMVEAAGETIIVEGERDG